MTTPMTAKELDELRSKLKEKIDTIPQRAFIADADVEGWVNKVLQQEPERAWWHYNRLFGIGGSEIGVLLGAEKGWFHPFSSASQITKQKLMREGLTEPNGDCIRGTVLEPTARDIYRAEIVRRGGSAVLNDELSEKFSQWRNPDHPWLVGNPDDIIEENGVIYMVDYKIPMPDQLRHYDQQGVPFYYAAQLHHYKIIAEGLGLKVGGLRLCSLNLKTFTIDERNVEIDPETTAEILRVGDKYWNEYVMRGKPAPMVHLSNSSTLEDLTIQIANEEMTIPVIETEDRNQESKATNLVITSHETVDSSDLRERLKEFTELFYAWRVLKIESEEMSEMFGEAVEQILPLHVLPESVDEIDANAARIKIKRGWDEDRIVEQIKRLGKMAGESEAAIEEMLSGQNYTTAPTFNAEKLVEILRSRGIDVTKDSDFAPAIEKPAAKRVDTMVSLLRDLDVTGDVDWPSLRNPALTKVSVELTREPFTGPLNENRQEMRKLLRKTFAPQMTEVAAEFSGKRADIAASLLATPPKKKPKPK